MYFSTCSFICQLDQETAKWPLQSSNQAPPAYTVPLICGVNEAEGNFFNVKSKTKIKLLREWSFIIFVIF